MAGDTTRADMCSWRPAAECLVTAVTVRDHLPIGLTMDLRPRSEHRAALVPVVGGDWPPVPTPSRLPDQFFSEGAGEDGGMSSQLPVADEPPQPGEDVAG